MMRQFTTRALVLFTLFLAPAESLATPLLGIAGDLGFGALDDTAATTIQAGLDVQEGRLAVALFGRVRLMLSDQEEVGAIRRRDWDEASDFVHILRTLRYSRQFQTFNLDVRVGEVMAHTLGHGSLMRDYSNISDPDHQHTGLSFRLAHPRFEVEALLDNFIRPGVAALRGTVSPLSGQWGRGFKLGASLAMDPTAPVAVQVDEKGRRAMDAAYNLQSDTRVLTMMEVDASYRLHRHDLGMIEPYVDVATSFMGMGVHAGAVGQVRLGPDGEYILGLQAEYHYSGAGYAPAYMTTFYDVERHQAGLAFRDPRQANSSNRNTKYAGMARGLYEGHGGLVQLGLEVGQKVRAKVGYGFRPGPDAHQMWVRFSSQASRRLNVGLLLVMRGLEAENELANGVVAAAEARFRLTDNVYGLAQYSRTWTLNERTRYFGILQSFNLSAGYNWDA